MDRTERFYRIDQLLNDRKLVKTNDFLEDLGVSLATFKRDLLYMQNHLHAPIVFDHHSGGYRFEQSPGIGPRYELPGLWFNESEIHALLVAKHLLEEIQPGILEPHIQPLISRLKGLLDSADHSVEEIEKRISIETPARRPVNGRIFGLCVSGVLKKKQLTIRHRSRYDEDVRNRHLSPQRLTYYKNTWYLNAWCHERNALRSFSVDAIEHVDVLEDVARDVPLTDLQAVLESGYGVFGGQSVEWAKLRFTPYQAKWTSTETWHFKQKGYYEADGSYILEIPYSSDSELVMDILRYGHNVEVLSPDNLRAKVIDRLKRAFAQYA